LLNAKISRLNGIITARAFGKVPSPNGCVMFNVARALRPDTITIEKRGLSGFSKENIIPLSG